MSWSRNWHKWLVLLGLALSARPIGCNDYSAIAEKFGADAVARCNEKCPFQNRTGDGHFDLSCGSDCSTQQCSLGCGLWKQGLETSCQTSCNVTSETVVSRELYCVIGCNEALNSYYQKLRELIGTPQSPALVADSLTPTSLSLVWEAYGAMANLRNLSFLVQWRYEELPGSWQYSSNDSFVDRSIINVWNLRPYTKYRFRVAIFLSGRGGSGEPIYSAESVVISTLDSGKPSSPPSSLRAAAPDPSRIAISWEPGPFPNGPLIGFDLRLADTQPNVFTTVNDMSASNNTFFYMYQNLAPAREYEVSVSMRNAVGEGPRAYMRVFTPPLPTSIPQQPVLILGGEQNILAAPANDMLSDPIELYRTEHKITGVGLDISSDYLFVSVSNGFVYRSSLSKKSDSIPILTPDSKYKPLDLSVDWLNRHLYVLGEVFYNKVDSNSDSTIFSNWEILRCDFDGKNQLIALSGFTSRPIHFEVDPYNGYLFWALRGVERGGLYRLDLANISNGVRHDAPPEQIVRDAHLGAFTVDHKDFRLLVAHLRRNNILAVSLDGREVTDFRSNTQTPMFKATRSIAYANGLFYWTNGKEMLTEEYHAKTDSYYHNEYPIVFNMSKIVPRQVLVNLRGCQPIPVPVNPPIGVQSVMGIDRGKVSWSPPHLLGHQGIGAWQQWKYHVQLTCAASGDVIDMKDINGSTIKVDNLKPDSEYVVKVAAVTESGAGPWSSEFVGKTLVSSPATLQSTMLWAGPDGLLQTDLTGENLNTLIYTEQLKNIHITDISWYQDMLYLVTNASTVLWYNITTNEKAFMENMDNVGSMAVDWVGRRIYWSNPKQQLITRANLDGGNREPVPIVTVAKELTIDSMEAYIYWNTGHAVEAARLNGENKMVYYPAQLFSGKQVTGLATDLENRWVYWLVRSYDGSELHRAPTADRFTQTTYEGYKSLVRAVGSSQSAALGPLCYARGRLVWAAAGRAVVADVAGRYSALLGPRVLVLALRDPAARLHAESLIAIPESIDSDSIKVSGTWDSFNVSWAPARRVNVNNSKVYYDVSLQFSPQHKIERTVDQPHIEVSSPSVPAYSAMSVSVAAHTHWGGGGAAHATTWTPQAAPAPPRAPRLYTQPQHSGGYLTAIFRWQPPLHSNGIIRNYETQCWLLPHEANLSDTTKPSACADAILPPTHTQLMLRDLIPGARYFFQVRASTDAGYGPYSDIVEIYSDDVNPIPKVMISSQESIKIVDLDSGDSETIPKSTGIPVDLAVSIEENIVYWVNNLEEIFSSRINGSGHYKLASLNGSATSMCHDWVSRCVFWSQSSGRSRQPARAVYRAELGAAHRPRRLLLRDRPVRGLSAVPLERSLYWYEESNNLGMGTLMTAKMDGSNIRPFFNSTVQTKNSCNCPENPQIARNFVIDMTRSNYEIYWIDPWTNQIIAADMQACKCRVVVEATEKKKYGFIPMSITVDSKYVYWFNSTERMIFYTTKCKKGKIEQIKASYGYKIVALDPANQPYPPRQCLFPWTNNLIPKIVANSANTITLQLPPVGKPEHCNHFEYEMSATEYTVYYRLPTANDQTTCNKETCPFITTTDNELVISELKPFTNYSVSLEVTNYYGKLHEIKPLVGASIILQTAAEAPLAATDVTATVLSPVLARVEWTPSAGLWYELHWRTDNLSVHSNKYKEHNTFEVSEGRAANMTRLSPATYYTVWIRARSPHTHTHTDSATLRVRTYPAPPPLRVASRAPGDVTVVWPHPTDYQIHEYRVEYTEASSQSWLPCTEENGSWVARDLQPRTRYRFRLRLVYAPNAPPYLWPHDDRFTYETKGDVPSAPGRLQTSPVGPRVLRAWWGEPAPRGAAVTLYRVWGRQSEHRVNDISDNTTRNYSEMLPKDLPSDVSDELKERIIREGLELLHNGTESYWLISQGELTTRYTVFVQACNSYGWGALSEAAELAASPPRPAAPLHATELVAAVAAMAVLLLVVAAPALYMYKNRGKKKPPLEAHLPHLSHLPHLPNLPLSAARRGPDVELATLRELPTRHSTNIIYNQGRNPPTDVELAALPHIRREQITLNKFLGSGAFGEVFEGVARGLRGAAGDNKVAVKTLRKGATDQEKTEFLQEAALMSNFKHEHILRLLGVCLDNDPNYIIMELMEGGDLLSYLRAKRSLLYAQESLTLLELLNMCVDVTKGCRYLEEMHFVHRDLACRNCLVAHRGAGRVVKIGDFGLARDIYKNDYYRKEGEGLLPVRWMAVECLIDGVFSCQSDVWAWAVLCWEVLSLGQQPYPARTNREVLAYVRAGGTPDRPPNCPSVLYELLQKCWSYSPEARPSFRQCLEVVTALRDKTSPHITLTAAAGAGAVPHYLTLLGDDAVTNRSYLLDENDNACLDEVLPESQMEPSHLLPERTPKYLELMYDAEPEPGVTSCDGYEMPRTPFDSNRSFMPASRHSIVGVAPNRLIKPPLYRTHSLRTNMRPVNATIIPLRNGIVKRASLCDELNGTFAVEPQASTSNACDLRVEMRKQDHIFQTPF